MKDILTAGVLVCVVALGGCDRVRDYLGADTPPPPPADSVTPYYAEHRGVDRLEVQGNVVELHVRQPYQQLQRGGSLWARVGPYVYLMTPSTRSVFEDFPGVAAVRVVTYLPDGEEVARAMLRRDTMSNLQWRRTLNILGHALQSGHQNPRKLEELTEWSEDWTEFAYSPDYTN